MVAVGLFGGAADDACELAAARKTASVETNAIEFEVFVNWASHWGAVFFVLLLWSGALMADLH